MSRARALRLAAAVALFVAVAALALRPLKGFDTWWHLASGREIVRQKALLTEDPFSFTSGGRAWMNHGWLWQTAAWSAWRAAGGPAGGEDLPGAAGSPVRDAAVAARTAREASAGSMLLILNAVLLASAFALAASALRVSGAGPLLTAGVVLLAAAGARIRFLVRPEAASILLLAVVLWLLDRSRRSGRCAPLFAVPVCIAIGANVHPGALAVAGLVALWAIGDLVNRWLLSRRVANVPPPVPTLPTSVAGSAALAAVSLLATGANPAGFRLWLVPLQLSKLVRAEGYFNPEWLPPRIESAPVFFAGLGALAGVVLVGLVRRRVDLASLLPVAALGVLALGAIRHTGLFLVALPFLGVSWMPRSTGSANSRRGAADGLAAAGAAAVAIGLFATGLVGLGIDRSTTPVDACDFIARHEPTGRLYNDVRFGGYLAYRFGPDRRVFIDGRNEVYPELLRELEEIYSGRAPYAAWRSLVSRHGIRGALVRYSGQLKGVVYPATAGAPERTGYRAYSAYLFPPGEWSLVYWDDTAMLFLMPGGPNGPLAERFAYEALNPEDIEHVLERAGADPAFREAVRRDLARRARREPRSRRAAEIEARLAGEGG